MSFQWLSLVAIIWLQSINGTNSNFPAYSSELKKILSISQLQLNNLAFASDAGKLLGWISGIAATHLPLWLLLVIGSLLGVLGYGLQFLFITSKTHPLSYFQVFTLTILAGNSICWINTVCYIIAIRNFPSDRQIAVGISTSYVGLSAKIYTDVVGLITPIAQAEKRATDFLMLNALLPLLVCIVAAPLTYDVKIEKSKKSRLGFVVVLAITVVTGLFAVITSSVPEVPSLIGLVGLLGLLVAQLLTPLVEKVVEHECCSVIEEKEDEEEEEEVEIGPLLMLKKLNFWLYYFVYLFGATVGLVYLNNLGQIGESRGFLRIYWLVSLASAFGFFGRLLPSLLDYFFPKRRYVISRASAMGVMTCPMSGAFFILVMSKRDLPLFISTAIISTCVGAISSIAVSTTRGLFGTKNFGMNHNILISNIAIGSFVFGDFAALLYNKGRADGEENCMGEKCYQTTFFIWACSCGVATLLALILHSTTKKLHVHS